jgi:hypothetical protein
MRHTFLCGVFLGMAALASGAPVPEAPSRFPDALVPADSSAVITVNFREVFAAKIVQKYLLDDLTKFLKRDTAGKLLEAAGIDPFKDLQVLTVGLTDDVKRPHWTGILRGRFDTEKLHKAIQNFATDNADKLTIEKVDEGNLYRLKLPDRSVFAAVAGTRAIVLGGAKEDVLAVLKKSEQAPSELNKGLQAAVAKLGAKEPISVAVAITDQLKDIIRKQDPTGDVKAEALESLTVRVELSDAMKVALAVHTTDPATAKMLRQKVEEALPLAALFTGGTDVRAKIAKEVVGGIKIGGEQTEVRVTLTITDEMIQKAAKADGK